MNLSRAIFIIGTVTLLSQGGHADQTLKTWPVKCSSVVSFDEKLQPPDPKTLSDYGYSHVHVVLGGCQVGNNSKKENLQIILEHGEPKYQPDQIQLGQLAVAAKQSGQPITFKILSREEHVCCSGDNYVNRPSNISSSGLTACAYSDDDSNRCLVYGTGN